MTIFKRLTSEQRKLLYRIIDFFNQHEPGLTAKLYIMHVNRSGTIEQTEELGILFSNGDKVSLSCYLSEVVWTELVHHSCYEMIWQKGLPKLRKNPLLEFADKDHERTLASEAMEVTGIDLIDYLVLRIQKIYKVDLLCG